MWSTKIKCKLGGIKRSFNFFFHGRAFNLITGLENGTSSFPDMKNYFQLAPLSLSQFMLLASKIGKKQ